VAYILNSFIIVRVISTILFYHMSALTISWPGKGDPTSEYSLRTLQPLVRDGIIQKFYQMFYINQIL